MSVATEVANYKIKPAILPSIEVTLRIKNLTGRPAYFASGTHDVYFGNNTSHDNLPFVIRVPSIIGQNAQPNADFRIYLDITFSAEILYRLQKLIPIGQDVIFSIWSNYQILNKDNNERIVEGTWANDTCVLEIANSNWVKISYDWSKEAALMPIAPKLYDKLKELARTGKYMGGTDDIIDEMINRYTKQELER